MQEEQIECPRCNNLHIYFNALVDSLPIDKQYLCKCMKCGTQFNLSGEKSKEQDER